MSAVEATQEAIKAAGGPTNLGRELGISRQAVEQWRLVPPERVLDVERITGVSRYRLRPDIYGAAPLDLKSHRRASARVAA